MTDNEKILCNVIKTLQDALKNTEFQINSKGVRLPNDCVNGNSYALKVSNDVLAEVRKGGSR